MARIFAFGAAVVVRWMIEMWASALGIGLGLLSVAVGSWVLYRAGQFGAGVVMDNGDGFGGWE